MPNQECRLQPFRSYAFPYIIFLRILFLKLYNIRSFYNLHPRLKEPTRTCKNQRTTSPREQRQLSPIPQVILPGLFATQRLTYQPFSDNPWSGITTSETGDELFFLLILAAFARLFRAFPVKSKIYFCSYEGEGKGFNQKKYADQILRGPLKEKIEQPGDFFCVEDNSKVHGKRDTRQSRGFCNAVRLSSLSHWGLIWALGSSWRSWHN